MNPPADEAEPKEMQLPATRRAPYSITELLAIGPCRGASGPSIDGLVRLGFRHIIDLNADPSEKALSRRAGILYHPIRTSDEFSIRSWTAKMKEVVSIIESADRRKERVYLHCTYGLGRSPTMAMAYLISKGWPVQAATEHVKKSAKLVWNEGNPVSKYEEILQAYARSISGRRSRVGRGLSNGLREKARGWVTRGMSTSSEDRRSLESCGGS